MNKKNSTRVSETDFEWLETATDDDIDYSDIPKTTPEMWKNAVARKGGVLATPRKVRVNMFMDADIVAHFKNKANGSGYQTLINEALRSSINAEDLEHMLRHVIREEMVAYATTDASSTGDSD